MHRLRTTLLGLAAATALLPSLVFALDTEGGDGGHDPAETSEPAPQRDEPEVFYANDLDDDNTIAIAGQPTIKVKLPGLCKLLGACR